MTEHNFSLAASIAALRKSRPEMNEWMQPFVNGGDIVAVNALLAGGISVNAKKGEQTPLYCAVESAQREMVAFLIDRGAELEHHNRRSLHRKDEPSWECALHLAARSSAEPEYNQYHPQWSARCVEIAHVLIDKAAKVSAIDDHGQTPLHHAVKSISVIERLLRAGAPVEVRDAMQKRTPLHQAAAIGHGRVIRLLIANGANVNACDAKGMTPLHLAADITDPDEYHRTPRHILEARHKDACQILIQNSADINAKNERGQTPLHIVAGSTREKPCLELFEAFIAKGADANVKDKKGVTPFDLAMGNSKIDRFDLHKWLARAPGPVVDKVRQNAHTMA